MARIAFRVDASAIMGTGHVRRCLALAQALQRKGALCHFITRPLGVETAALIADAGFSVTDLPAPDALFQPVPDAPAHAAWAGVDAGLDAAQTLAAVQDFSPELILVDHYAFAADWHRAVRQGLGCALAALDDLADRPLAVDWVIDPNAAVDHRAKYAACVPADTRILGGAAFALLAERYRTAAAVRVRETVSSIGIFMGGADAVGASLVALAAVRQVFAGPVEVVSTSANPHLAAVRAACTAAGARLSVDLPDLVDFFQRHDLHVGAAGGAAWERCRLGAVTVAVVCAENQRVVLAALAHYGAAHVVAQRDGDALAAAVDSLLHSVDQRRRLAQAAQALVDGRGAERVACALLADHLTVRVAGDADAPLSYAWRNHPSIRAVSRQSAPLLWADHERWWRQTVQDGRKRLFMAEIGGDPVGVIRFDALDEGDYEVSLYLDPDLQGLGLGERLLRAGEAAMRGEAVRRFTAQVLPGNSASARLFQRAGYQGSGAYFVKQAEGEI